MIVSASESAFVIFFGIVHNVFIPSSVISNVGNCSTDIIELRLSIERCFINKSGDNAFALTNTFQTIQKRCTLRPELDSCFDNVVTSHIDCFHQYLNGISVWKEIDTKVTDYVCKNNASVAYNLLEKNDESCSNIGLTELAQKCFLKFENPLPLYDVVGIAKQCRQLELLKSCMEKNEQQDCPQKVITETVTPIMNIVISHLCKNTKK